MSENVLYKIPGQNLGEASGKLPNAEEATQEYMEAETTDITGRRVVVTFHRHLYKRRKQSWYSWLIKEARYADDPDAG